MSNFTKVIQPTTLTVTVRSSTAPVPVFCKIEFTDGKLSISGVEGPKRNGDAWGSCGQIDITGEGHKPAEGWTAEQVARLAQVWKDHHLNDMRAGCEHQRRDWKPEEKVEIVTYKLTTQAWKDQEATRKHHAAIIKRGGTVKASETELALLNLPYERHDAPDADGPGSGMYEVEKRETKAAGWVYPKEDPRGLLTKACEVCGYKYGSSWLREEVPADVIEFLRSLPEATTKPAWV